jgi:hypothetical protein
MKVNNIENNDVHIDIRLLAFISLLYVLNALSVSNGSIGIALGFIGYFIIAALFLFGRIQESVLLYLILLTTSIEVQTFAFGYAESSSLYGFLILPYLGIFPVFALNLIIFMKLYFINKSPMNFGEKKNIKRIYKWSWIIFLMGIFMMLISLLLNDNGIINLSWYSSKLQTELFRVGLIFLTFQNFIGMLLKYKNFHEKLRHVLIHILIAMIPATLITIMFGLHGYYGASKDVLLMPLVTIFGVGILLFSIYTNSKYKIYYIILGIIFVLIMVNYSSPLGGKWILLLIFTPIVIILKNMKSKTHKSYFVVIILAMSFVMFIQYLPVLFENNTLLSRKFEQVKSLVMITQTNWYANLSESPKFRIDEFINILYEYYKKPYYFLFGKGHGGTVIQHTATLNWNTPGAFTRDEAVSGVYMRLHSSINLIFIKYGVIGLVFFVNVIYLCLKNIHKNSWIVIGMIWFLLFYGGYTTLLFGAVALILGIYDSEFTKKSLKKSLVNSNNIYGTIK